MLDYARRFDNLRSEMDNALAELRDNSAGRLAIGANESTTLYLLPHIAAYRRLYPRVRVQVRRSLSSRVPSQIVEGDLELGVISYDPQDPRVESTVIYTDHLAFVVSPRHRFASRKSVSINDLGMEMFIAHNVVSPYRNLVLRAFERAQGAAEHGRRDADGGDDPEDGAGERGRGVPAEDVRGAGDRAAGACARCASRRLKLARQIRLIYPARRALSHAARAFLDLIKGKGRVAAMMSGPVGQSSSPEVCGTNRSRRLARRSSSFWAAALHLVARHPLVRVRALARLRPA